MKLCKEMVDAMGGLSSMHYQKFKSLCYTAFMILRKSANLILNLFALMVSEFEVVNSSDVDKCLFIKV
jgi:phosphatidylinositol 3-kinase